MAGHKVEIGESTSLVKLIPEKVNETRLMLRNELDGLMLMYDSKEDHSFVGLYKDCRKRVLKTGKHKHQIHTNITLQSR